MKVTYKNGVPVVPKGWRKLRRGITIHSRDMWPSYVFGTWRHPLATLGEKVDGGFYIRRKKGTK